MLIDVSTMSRANVFDLVTVGHFALDTILSTKIIQPKITLGGSPTYVSVAAAKLGASVSVISKVGEDFPNEYSTWLRNNDVDLSGLRVSTARTTHYVLEYKNWMRQLRLETQAPPILSTDIPSSLDAQILHVSPIANEVSSTVVTRLRKLAKVLSLDPQGFVRTFDKSRNVHLKRWLDSEVLEQTDIFKSATSEIQAVTGTKDLKLAMKHIGDYGIEIVIVTRGLKGSTLLFDKKFYNIPVCKSKTVVDPTGAGDAYIGAFLAEYLRDKDLVWCCSVGSAAASFVVEDIGPTRFGERHEVYERANGIYEKVVGKKKVKRGENIYGPCCKRRKMQRHRLRQRRRTFNSYQQGYGCGFKGRRSQTRLLVQTAL